ncbi:hypothetical protein SCUP515_05707 [Seiridium cupressi]
MGQPCEFRSFPRLPPELRRHIWLDYFQSPRVHGILEVCPRRQTYKHRTFSMSWDTRITGEAHRVATEYEKQRSTTYSTANASMSTSNDALIARYKRWGTQARPCQSVALAYVNWEQDVVYLGPMCFGDPFEIMTTPAWAGAIEHLAIHITPGDLGLAETRLLPFFDSLRTLYIVVNPRKGSEHLWRMRRRDEYGFVVIDQEMEYGLTAFANDASRSIGYIRQFRGLVGALQRLHFVSVKVVLNLDFHL